MIEILTAAQVDRARRTGALVADILRSLRERSLVGTNLLMDNTGELLDVPMSAKRSPYDFTHGRAHANFRRQVEAHGYSDLFLFDAAHAAGAPVIEIHTGAYADAATDALHMVEFERIRKAVAYGCSIGLTVNAGHGLTYHNVQPIAALPGIHELNIGHAIVAQALFVGWKEAVSEMKRLMVVAAG